MAILLSTLLKNWLNIPDILDRPITGLALNSKQVKPGDLFFAHIEDYIHEAIAKGATAVVVDKMPAQLNEPIPIFELKNLKYKIGLIAANFYQHPSKDLRVIGVTGTNGKTSCTQFIAQALKMAGQRTAVIGTLGNGLTGQLAESNLTTPDPIQLQQLLATFRDQGVNTVAIETSSHGLEQGRINGTQFSIGIFTNLSRDHLDYHVTFDAYAKAKQILFEQPGLNYAVINADDTYGKQWLNSLNSHLKLFAYTTHHRPIIPSYIPLIKAEHIHFSAKGITASLSTPWGNGVLQTELLGKFNIYNLLAVITTLGIMGIPLQDILLYASSLKGVTGRMQTFRGKSYQPLVVVDYAHTPDALKSALLALREHCEGELWCVFGCGGDRDRGKRPEMGHIAQQYADQIIITNDNPRQENPNDIAADIIEGIDSTSSYIIELDRRRAIAHAISCADAKDIVLIAGKGHETYQIIGNEKIPYSDILEVKMLLLDEV